MSNHSRTTSPSLNGIRIVLPLASLVALIVAWRLGERWLGIAAVAAAAAALFVLPRLVAARLAAFDRQAMKLLATGRAAEVQPLSRAQFTLALFGPSGCMDGKLGLASVQIGRYAEAVLRLSNALPHAQGAAVLPLKAGLCKAYLLTANPSKAAAEAEDIARSGVSLAEVQAVRATAAFLLGKPEAARDAAKGARTLSPSSDVCLMLDLLDAELDLAAGKTAQLPETVESTQPFLVAWSRLVQGKLQKKSGHKDAAQVSFAQALELDKHGFVGAAAKKLLNPEKKSDDEVRPEGRDPAVARKKRRR